MAKSLIVTYILWLFGGFLGLHHFYLNRIIHGFLYMCCPGTLHQSKIQENHFGFKDQKCDKVQFSVFQEAILERVGFVTYGGYQVT